MELKSGCGFCKKNEKGGCQHPHCKGQDCKHCEHGYCQAEHCRNCDHGHCDMCETKKPSK